MDDAKRVVGASATFFFAALAALAAAGLVFCEPILVAMKTPPDSLRLADGLHAA